MAEPKKTATKRTPRKRVARAKEYVEEKVIPVVVSDAQKIWGLPKWLLYTIGAVVIIIASKLFYDGCNKRAIEKNAAKIEQTETEIKARDSEIIKLRDSLSSVNEILDELYSLSTKSTEDRIRIDEEGEAARDKIKKITDEIKEKINDPRTTDSDRDDIERELLRARQAAKVHSTK
jgi:predicted GTPase